MKRAEEKELLLQLRSKLAFESKSAHSWSFSDKEMNLLLDSRPMSIEDLGQLKGFPLEGKRVKAYGNCIVDIFLGKSISDFNAKIASSGEDLIVKSILKKSNLF